ncbi:hypothetical protein FRC05_001514 [Tulasnella sp. 425]|nr:hypothetical protein FRC05_001514 [Tulasnella sp. 425]
MPITPPIMTSYATLTDIPPELVAIILLLVEMEDIFSIRQTCTYLLSQTKDHGLWTILANRAMEDKNVVWPSWGLPLAAMPSSTIEDLVVRATRLPSLAHGYWSRIDRRNAFEGGIQRPFDSPMSLYLIRGRWLLVESSDFTLELWDLDAPEYTHPSATYASLEGPIDGITHVDGIDGVKITLSTSKEMRTVKPSLTPLDSFGGYSLVKTRRGSLLAFAACVGDGFRACVVDESTRDDVELSLGGQLSEIQRTLDIKIQYDVVFVVRRLNLELYTLSGIEEALRRVDGTVRSVLPFWSFSYPITPLLHSPQFHSTIPAYFDAPEGSVAFSHFVDDQWQAIVVTPQAVSLDPTERSYKIDNVFAIGSGIDPIYGIRTGENGYRIAMLGYGRLTMHYGRPWDTREVPNNGAHSPSEAIDTGHTLVSWEIPDFEVDLPRPGCLAIDEAVGICVAGMGSGRIWIGDAVPREKPKRVDVTPLPNKTALPDPRWPELPPSYYWDKFKFYSGPLSESDPIGEVAPGWSTAVDYYWPWRNDPKAYGGMLWFVENIMGLPGPARSLLFSTSALFKSGDYVLDLHEYVDIGGKLFRVLTNDELWEVNSLVDGTTIDDVITNLQQRRPTGITGEEWISDYMPIEQHQTWYRLFKRSRET